jgi:hypothetical protein
MEEDKIYLLIHQIHLKHDFTNPVKFVLLQILFRKENQNQTQFHRRRLLLYTKS